MNITTSELILNCASWHEAQNVIDELLIRGLITQAEIIAPEGAKQVSLIIESVEDNIQAIRQALTAFPRFVQNNVNVIV